MDTLDQLADFCREFPAWCGSDGKPLSWAHFVVGSAHLGRHRARAKLRSADAYAVTQTGERDRSRWIHTHEIIADL